MSGSGRVLFVQGAGERGGAERALLCLMSELPGLGLEPVMAALADGPFLDEVRDAGVTVVPVAASVRARQLWRVGPLTEAIATLGRQLDAGVVHVSGEKMALFGGRAASAIGRPCVVWLHDAPFRDARSAAIEIGMRLSPRSVAVVPSAWMARAFRLRLRLSTELIPYGIDVSPARTPRPHADLARELGWPERSTIVTHVARLQRWKGADVFLRAAARVGARRPDLRFLVVGGALYGWEQDYAASLPVLAARLGLGARVHFAGHRDDAMDLMSASDVVVHSSRRPEPFGLVVAEAMVRGRAVIASRTGGPEEQIDDGVTGLLVPPGDDAALAAAMERLAGDGAVRAAMGAAATEVAVARWSARATAKQFVDLYHRLGLKTGAIS